MPFSNLHSRFLLNRLASSGDVDSVERLGSRLSPSVKKEVSFDNRLCNAYLAAGRAERFLELLEREVEGTVAAAAAVGEDIHPDRMQVSDVQSLGSKL